MTLAINSIEVRDFRNYRRFVLELDPELTILVGPNAVGKTNLIEALELLTSARSFRKPSWTDTIRYESLEGARLQMKASGDGRDLSVVLTINPAGRRTYEVNGKTRRAVNQVAGVIPCVVFTPEDLSLIKGAAEQRRSALDHVGEQLSPAYASLRSEYDKILRQRNVALKEDRSADELEVWTERLIETGAALITHRRRLFERLREAMRVLYPQITADGHLSVQYLCSWERRGLELPGEPVEALRFFMERTRDEERGRKTTVAGPHRDDVEFRIDGRDARTFASQGQQRTLALVWKMAEVAVITDVATQKPLLLLDDVMSELDETRRHALAAFVGSVAQTVVTTTNLGYFEDSLLDKARVVMLG